MDKVLPWFILAALFVVWAGLEWLYYLTNIDRQPLLSTVAAIVVGAIAVWRIRRLRLWARRLKQGLEGERVVGQFLEGLRADGYLVLHDIEQDRGNIDHVLIGPTGVFAIETKTISKPTDRDAQIVYDGERVVVDGHVPDRDPLKQAEAGAAGIRSIIRERTGENVPVRPVALYPGWYIQRRCHSPQVWVLNEKYLPGWLDHEPETLTKSDVRRLAAVLEDYVRGRSC